MIMTIIHLHVLSMSPSFCVHRVPLHWIGRHSLNDEVEEDDEDELNTFEFKLDNFSTFNLHDLAVNFTK